MPEQRFIRSNASGWIYNEKEERLKIEEFRGCRVSWARRVDQKILFKLHERKGVLSLSIGRYKRVIQRRLITD